MKILVTCFFLAPFALTAYGQTPLRPYPQHVAYAAGSIKPTNFTQTQLDNSVIAFYNQWKAVYLKNDCGAGQYYVWFDESSANNSICVSEGQGYGMMITAYLAGYDANAKVYFDGLYNFYKAHPSVNNNKLMAWNQIAGCIDDPMGGNTSATDGDLDIAFALLLADKQWGSTGSINYFSEALAIIDAIEQDDVNTALWIPKLGDWVEPGYTEYDDTRTSDFIPDHFRAFQYATGNAGWNNLVNECYALIDLMQTSFSPATGLLPDFIVDVSASAHPAPPNYLEGPYDGDYYYNACRTPLRIGTDYLLSGDTRGKDAVMKINNWIRAKTGNDPFHIYAGYRLNGSDIPGNDYEAAAFAGPLAVAAMADASHQTWLNGAFEFLLTLVLPDYEYYDNTLKLLCMIVLSGNYWVPQGVPGAVEEGFVEDFHVEVYPNPFTSSFTVSIPGREGRKIDLALYDVFGRLVYSATEDHAGRSFVKSIEPGFLARGLYDLQLCIDGRRIDRKILKQ
jgi:endo-1,4-beta-D-glucanase Y